MESEKQHNILVFGETGSGKSSTIKYLSIVKRLSTFESNNSPEYEFFETLGIDDGRKVDAMKHLVQTVETINKKGGLNLIIFVSGLKINNRTVECWKFLKSSFSTVPILCLITGIDNFIEEPTEKGIENWWKKSNNEEQWTQLIDNPAIEITPVCFMLTGINAESQSLQQLRQISAQVVWKAIERVSKDKTVITFSPPKYQCLLV